MISVITPNLNMLPYLKKCHASIIDQAVEIEHIVVDGGSTDGSVEWLKSTPAIVAIVEADEGMYDALNKGFSSANGDIICQLNSDEQYLPGTLKKINSLFIETNADIIYGNRIVINENGEFIKEKRSMSYNKNCILYSHLYISTCSVFYRRKIIDNNLRFDSSLHSVGDADFLIKVHDAGFKSQYFNIPFATFTLGTHNLSNKVETKNERKFWQRKVIKYSKFRMLFFKILSIIRKLLSGYYKKSNLSSIFIYSESHLKRSKFIVKK